jgi:hypothetical protein
MTELNREIRQYVGRGITLYEVPEALELRRRSEGPPRIVVHPNG